MKVDPEFDTIKLAVTNNFFDRVNISETMYSNKSLEVFSSIFKV